MAVPVAVAPEPALVEHEPAVPPARPEPEFAARMPAAVPVRPLPDRRHGVFFDVENSSRPEHVSRVLEALELNWIDRRTDLIAVGNWRVVSNETARLLAGRGAQLVHSAPAVGVRDWSDLRIAVAAGCWLASARAGDALAIVTDDQAFDAVGDVAASLGVTYRRLSYRALAGVMSEAPVEEPRGEPQRRSRRGGRGRRGWRDGGGLRASGPPKLPLPSARAERPAIEPHTAPHDEILGVVHDMLAASPNGVSLDALSNALKARGFRRPPGSPRLITRIHRIKELTVAPGGLIRLADAAMSVATAEPIEPEADAGEPMATSDDQADAPADGQPVAAAEGAQRRRRRRGGRRRRGRGRNGGTGEAGGNGEGNGSPSTGDGGDDGGDDGGEMSAAVVSSGV
ncbi:MAG: hypothetical protein U0807_05970 [Candidatus Binatia bacterium]